MFVLVPYEGRIKGIRYEVRCLDCGCSVGTVSEGYSRICWTSAIANHLGECPCCRLYEERRTNGLGSEAL